MLDKIVPFEVLELVATSLGDYNRRRWSNENLLKLYNLSSRTICILHKPIVQRDFVSGFNGNTLNTQLVYDYGDWGEPNHIIGWLEVNLGKIDMQTWTRVSSEPLPFYTLREADKRLPKGWRFRMSSKPEAIIKLPNTSVDELLVYPTMDGNMTGYGLDITYQDLDQDIDTGNMTDESLLPPIYRQALVHHMVSQAIRLNQDTQNRQYGFEEFKLFQAEMSVIAKLREDTVSIYNAKDMANTFGGSENGTY